MRFSALLAAAKATKEPVPFQELLPLKLKATVSGKGDKSSEVCCVQEMTIMLSCFKTNEFDQSLCSKEIKNFQQCYMGHLDKTRTKREREEKGMLVPGERKLTHKQVNILLKRYPNVK